MRRFAAHFLYCAPEQIISKGVVELDDVGKVCSLFTLNDFPEETHSTEFFNGIIIPNILNEDDLQASIGLPIFEVLNKKIQSPHDESIMLGIQSSLMLLEQLDLVNLRILPSTRLRKLL